MLTKDLLRIRSRKNKLYPQYIDPENEKYLNLAENLIEVFEEGQGKRRCKIEEELSCYHEGSPQFVLVRGLIKLLFDRCDFDVRAEVKPEILRKKAFALAAERRASGDFDREEILQEVARDLEIDFGDVEEDLYSDLKSHQRLIKCKTFTPSQLLHRYNLALAQGLLLRATALEVEVRGKPGHYRQLFQYIKFFRLLYRLKRREDGGYSIRLDGPLSLFKSSTKYGMQMANFLLALVNVPHFSLEAKVKWGKKKKIKNFELDSSRGLTSHFPDPSHWMPEEFKIFRERFEKMETTWEVEENFDIVSLENEWVFIPDYRFICQETKEVVHLEIFGFWKPRGLEKRLKAMGRNDLDNYLLAISEPMLVSSKKKGFIGSSPPENVYIYKRVLIPRDIHSKLEEIRGVKRES